MKKIGFLSFGHWTPSRQSGTQSAADALLQSIELAVEAEKLVRTAPISACITSPASSRPPYLDFQRRIVAIEAWVYP
jgi:hypothetical protein